MGWGYGLGVLVWWVGRGIVLPVGLDVGECICGGEDGCLVKV